MARKKAAARKAPSKPPRFGKGQPVNYCGKKGRSGAPRGNLNAAKTGTKIDPKRLTVGELPPTMISVKREGRAYRRKLEAEVLAIRDEINALDSHHIDTASCATLHAAICRWLLRKNVKKMNTAEILSCSREMVKAKQARDAAVKLLDLDAKPASPWAIDVESDDDDN